MRVSSINGKSVTELLATAPRARSDSARKERGRRGPRGASPWALRREFRSTLRDSLTVSERVVAGKWFGPNRPDSLGEVSLDTRLDGEPGVHLNDTIALNLHGVPDPILLRR